jgi:uncharacterized protein
MDAINIPNLAQRPDKSLTVEFRQNLADLVTLTPVEGVVTVNHRSNFLEVKAQANTIVTLCCDRCLQNYNHRLAMQTEEIIWLKDAELDLDNLPLDEDLDLDDMVESLPKDGRFEVETWVYEQLCLALPPRQLCDEACKGIELAKKEAAADQRWAKLEALRQQLPDTN